MPRVLLLVPLSLALAAVPASAGTYVNAAEHFTIAIPAGLAPLSAAGLSQENAALAAAGGTPTLFEAGFTPAAGGKGPRYAPVLIRYVPGRTTFQSLADNFRADTLKAATAGSTSRPTTAPATAPAVMVDDAAHVVASEERRAMPAGTMVIRKTIFVGRDGLAEIDWTGPAADVPTQLKPMLASFKWDAGFEYTAPDVYVVRTATPRTNGRRTVATVIVWGVVVLFLAFAVLFFVRARRRNP